MSSLKFVILTARQLKVRSRRSPWSPMDKHSSLMIDSHERRHTVTVEDRVTHDGVFVPAPRVNFYLGRLCGLRAETLGEPI